MLDFSDLNYLAIAVAFVINMALGAFWYSPMALGNMWSKATGIKLKDMRGKNGNVGMFYTAVAALVQVSALAVLVNTMGLTTFKDGVELGLLLWVGFVAASTASDAVFARRGWKLWSINSKFYLFVLVINSVLFATWN